MGACFPYEEQTHFFAFSGTYAQSLMLRPGGVALWLSEFLTQFGYIPMLGAATMTLVYALLFFATFIFMEQMGAHRCVRLCALYPVFVLMSVCLFSLQVPMALLITLTSIILVGKISNLQVRAWVLFLLVPVIYFVAGSQAFIVVGLYPFLVSPYPRRWLMWGGVLLYALLLPVAVMKFVQYPLWNLYVGINDVALKTPVDKLYYWSMGVYLFIPMFARVVDCKKVYFMFASVGFAAVGVIYPVQSFNTQLNNVLQYDYLVRHQEWDKIIEHAETHPSKHSMSVVSVNLALAMTGRLESDLFKYPQNGCEGLLENTGQKHVASFPVIDAYHRIGLTEVARRGAFEFQESLPYGRKSGRCMKYLAETTADGGNDALSARYRRLLSKTLFYSIEDESQKRVGKQLPDSLATKMFFYYDMPNWLQSICESDRNNRVARQYFVAWLLLSCDMERFMQAMPLLAELYSAEAVPVPVMEAVAYLALQNDIAIDSMPIKVSQRVLDSLGKFIGRVRSGVSSEVLRSEFPHSFWTYLVTKR